MSRLGYAGLPKFCSVLWLSLGWTKHSWDRMTDFLLNEELISSEDPFNKGWLHFLRVCPGPMGGTTGTGNWNGWLAPTTASSDLQFNSIKGGAGCWAACKRVRGFSSSRREMEAGCKQEKSQHYSSSVQSERFAPGAGERAPLWLNYSRTRRISKCWMADTHSIWQAYTWLKPGGAAAYSKKTFAQGTENNLSMLGSTSLFYHLQSIHNFPRYRQRQRQCIIPKHTRQLDFFFMSCKGLLRPTQN